MSAEEQIRQTMGRYIQAHDTHDVDAIVALFIEDGLFANTRGDCRGHAAIREFFENSRTRAQGMPDRRAKLLCGNSVITVSGDSADAVTDVVGFQRSGSDPWSVWLVAQYADKFVRRNGEWLYAEKRVLGA
jgi:ketosteroid isomerase-like protein